MLVGSKGGPGLGCVLIQSGANRLALVSPPGPERPLSHVQMIDGHLHALSIATATLGACSRGWQSQRGMPAHAHAPELPLEPRVSGFVGTFDASQGMIPAAREREHVRFWEAVGEREGGREREREKERAREVY